MYEEANNFISFGSYDNYRCNMRISYRFSILSPSGAPAGQEAAWGTGSRTPWAWRQPRPWTPQARKRKSHCQWKRDQKRKTDFLVKKASSCDVKEEINGTVNAVEKATTVEPVDEISLIEIPDSVQEEAIENDLFKIVGEYKNPKFKPFSVVEPEKEIKVFWEMITNKNIAKGIKEIGEGSTCLEHSYEFWGTWRVEKRGRYTLEVLKCPENWPRVSKY
jgi:hypothetical protein